MHVDEGRAALDPVFVGRPFGVGTHLACLWRAGKDATEDFEEIGHSNAAKGMLDKYHIGGYEVSCQFLSRPGMHAVWLRNGSSRCGML